MATLWYWVAPGKSLLLRRNVILMGSPGAGKTTVGQIVAGKLGLTAVDIDNDFLEHHWKMPVSQKLAEVGSDNFVFEEGQALLHFSATGCVVSLSGSNPMFSPAMERMRQLGVVVLIDVDHADILERLEVMKVNRIVGQTDATPMRDILEYRQQFYEGNYDVRIICESQETPESIGEKIVSALEKYDDNGGYESTRQSSSSVTPPVSFNDVVLQGLAPDGGLYVPRQELSAFSLAQLNRLVPLTYPERALRVLERLIHPDDLHPSLLARMVSDAYSRGRFASEAVFPVVQLGDSKRRQFLVEMFHGPTASFKDGALQLIPHFFHNALSHTSDQRYLILVATSGDTGSAVLSGFGNLSDSSRVAAMVMYPDDGISAIQKAQMVTASASNVHVLGVQSDFDFCQSSIKNTFRNAELAVHLEEKYGVRLSAANSINWGRLVPQIVYHVSAYVDMVREGHVTMGEPVDLCVPTGNFGNILSAFYAKTMGVPFRRLICASNQNNILTEFLQRGVYDLAGRSLHRTMSPAIDILKSSNLERYLHHRTGGDGDFVATCFSSLEQQRVFQLPNELFDIVREDLVGDWCSEEECHQTIQDTFTRHGYLLDPHTAVAMTVADRHHDNSSTPMLISATAHYGKFGADVLSSLGISVGNDVNSVFKGLSDLKATPGMHRALEEAVRRPVMHTRVMEADDAAVITEVEAFIRRVFSYHTEL